MSKVNVGELARFKQGKRSHVSPRLNLYLDLLPGTQYFHFIQKHFLNNWARHGNRCKRKQRLQSRRAVLNMGSLDLLGPIPQGWLV